MLMFSCMLVYKVATYLPAEGLELNLVAVFGSEDVLFLYGDSDCFGVGLRLGGVAFLITGRHREQDTLGSGGVEENPERDCTAPPRTLITARPRETVTDRLCESPISCIRKPDKA